MEKSFFQPDESTEASAKDVFEENYKELIKWVDAKSTKYGNLTVLRERRCGRCGSALKVYSPYQAPVSMFSCNYKDFNENRS